MDVKVDVRGGGYPPTPGQPWLAAGPVYRAAQRQEGIRGGQQWRMG